MTDTSKDVLGIRDLVVEYSRAGRRKPLRAVDGVSLAVRKGETVGIVGESGSGKSTIGRALLGLTPVKTGKIELNGQDITSLGARDRRALSDTVQVVFQDTNSSLNPARTVGQTLRQPLQGGPRRPAADVQAQVTRALEGVGLPAASADRYPSALSGGQRQRVAIARALMTSPSLVVCDEAVASLDLPIQAQVINLLKDLQAETGVGYLFITHDMAVVRHIADWIVVLYKGRVMEAGPTEQICTQPTHPYTRGLVLASPVPDVEEQAYRRAERRRLRASVDVTKASQGCPYAPRCHLATDVCWVERPAERPVNAPGICACHHAEEGIAAVGHAAPLAVPLSHADAANAKDSQ